MVFNLADILTASITGAKCRWILICLGGEPVKPAPSQLAEPVKLRCQSPQQVIGQVKRQQPGHDGIGTPEIRPPRIRYGRRQGIGPRGHCVVSIHIKSCRRKTGQ